MIFRESSKGTNKSINMSKSSIEESTIYQYISLPVSGNYTVTAHDIVNGIILTNPSIVHPQVLDYTLLLRSPNLNNNLNNLSYTFIAYLNNTRSEDLIIFCKLTIFICLY